MSSTLGTLFKVTTFGESHGIGVGAVVDGCPAGLPLCENDIQPQLTRRRPGQSALTTPREENDTVRILSGVENGVTLGTPISLLVNNSDQRPGDYTEMQAIPRPSHADFTYRAKYGVNASSGGGRSSARETIGRVAAGAIAEQWLARAYGIEIVGYVQSVGDIEAPSFNTLTLTRQMVDSNIVRCPDPKAANAMTSLIEQVKNEKDSIGGVVGCICRNVPVGIGDPIFDKLEALLAQAMLSIPATKGFEFGSGFAGTRLRGSVHNDPFTMRDGHIVPLTNNSGGIQGGISNGAPIEFRVAFKPPATIGLPQQTVNYEGTPVTLQAKGRHDPCVVPRAVVIVEAMAALVLADAVLRQRAYASSH